MNKNRIFVQSIQPGAKAYYFAFAEDKFVGVCYFDSSGKPAQRITLLDEPSGEIFTSSSKDAYGNKNCYHHYKRFSGDVGLSQLTNLTTRVYLPPGGTPTLYLDTKYSGSVLAIPLLGKGGVVSSNNSYSICKETSKTSYILEYYNYGALYYTVSYTVSAPPEFTSATQKISVKWTKETKYNPKNNPYSQKDSKVSYTSSVGLAYLDITKSVEYDLVALRRLFDIYSARKIGPHFVPDNFVDLLFEKLTIPDVNNIENLKDLKDIKKSLPPILKLLRKRNFKSLADFYLWYKYSYSTTKLDLLAYYDFFQKQAQDLSRSDNFKRLSLYFSDARSDGSMFASTVTRYNILTDTYSCSLIKSLGLSLNLGNTWDLLPFSFVVDWFVNLGDILSRIDHFDTVSEMRIRTSVASTKEVITFQPLVRYGCTSLCTVASYQRDVLESLPIGRFEVSLKNPANHILDGLALVVSRH